MSSSIYEDPKWKEKRIEILKRDNFTCQCCHTFNPGKGLVFVYYDDYFETHHYSHDIYTLYSTQTGTQVRIKMYHDRIVMPVLQVHHKCYIEGKNLWEYNNDDLVTLCKKCHIEMHQNHKIPIYLNDDRNFITSYCTEDPDNYMYDNHDFEPWTLVNKDYEETTHLVFFAYYDCWMGLVDADQEKIAKKMIIDFLNQKFPNVFYRCL